MLRRKKSSLVRVRRLFRGQTLQFDSNGKVSGYNKEIQVHKPSIRIPPLGPYLLLSEDNTVLHRVDTRLKIPTFTRISMNNPPPPKPSVSRYLPSPIHQKLKIPLTIQKFTLIPTIQHPPPSPTQSTVTTTTLAIHKPNKLNNNISKYFS